MRITVRQLKRIINEEVKRVILEAGARDHDHDMSVFDHEGVRRYNELWDMLQSNEEYHTSIQDAINNDYLDDMFVEDLIYSTTGAVRAGRDQHVVETLAQNIVNDEHPVV